MRADGIALSTDGLIWTKGVGVYGDAWGEAGTGISVRAGSTVYIKFYTHSRENPGLFYADHGRREPNWTRKGPELPEDQDHSAGTPVILRITDVGTRKSTIAWINSPQRTGIWAGIKQPGSYDLALHYDAQWTLPPLTVTEDTKPGFWGNLAAWWNADQPAPNNSVVSVPDQGSSLYLFGFALAMLAAVALRRRRRGAA